LSYMRGDAVSFAVSGGYNFGYTKGFLPKIEDSLPYTAPLNLEPLGCKRPEETLAPEFLFVFQEQGLALLDIHLYYNCCLEKGLRFNILNETYRTEEELRCRLNHILAGIIPSDVEEVIVVINSEGFPIQEYHYRMEFVRLFGALEIGAQELDILTPLTEVTYPNPYTSSHILSCKRCLCNFEIVPRTHTLFGSASGKFKYALGVNFAFNGYLWDEIYYSVLIGYNPFTNIGDHPGYDRLNPSQLINVRTDIVRYYNQKGFTLDEAYLQKNWNVGRGLYARVSAGYFEEEYAGVAGEVLCYPIDSPLAVGFSGAIYKKRAYRGLGFTNKVRQMHGFKPSWKKFPFGSQFFLNVYYDLAFANVDFRVSAGKFLANDWGVRNEISRYFPSGLRLSIWYTLTNGHDHINGKTYYDKGIGFTMPFDIFYTYSERSYWNYYMSAWLRDVGVQAMDGLSLYYLINDQRQ